MLGDVEFAFALLDGESALLAGEVPQALLPAVPDEGVEDGGSRARDEPAVRVEKAARGRLPGWCVVLSFTLLGSVAFFFGASLRHKNATGASYVERIMDRLRTPDINRIRDLTGEDPEKIFVDRTAGPGVPVTVVEELPEEMQGWEDRDRGEDEGWSGGAGGVLDDAAGGGAVEPAETGPDDEAREAPDDTGGGG